MPQTETWTVGRLLEWTTTFLKSHGSDTPRLDAELLLAEARGCQRIELYTSFSEEPSESVRTAFRELVKRRADGMPVAYLLGRREFYSLSFRVTPDVLIPRPETEFLVIALLDLVNAAGQAAAELAIADVGTGSGILAVCAARELPNARVMAVDVSPAALAVARENAERYQVAQRMEFVDSDLLASVPAEQRFDYLVSNPPYVKSSEMASLGPGVAEYEPRVALEAGPRGTEVIERLIAAAAERLRPGGWLLLEISPQLRGEVEQLVTASGAFDSLKVIKDLAGLARVVQAQRKRPAS
ncbi:MAG: peptide chain release factor N(5)-glutamine methyltransferase [Pirellulales bacterium]|nr:peptide chain release factor N(5)-glutamine methyltransferase [Pirellulales bacterium]